MSLIVRIANALALDPRFRLRLAGGFSPAGPGGKGRGRARRPPFPKT